MHIHILGICGTFMGGVAQLAKALGHTVTGCDTQVYPPMSTQLEQAGIALTEGFGIEQLNIRPDVWVVGNVVKRGMPLIEAILNQGLPYTSGPQWVAEHILAGRTTLAVAGTHGKTTTSSMLAWVLDAAGLAPGFLIGGVPAGFKVSARLGHNEKPHSPFVIEADEYDTAFFDKRSKFVHYRPRVAVLNNLEFDHADIFPDLPAIETQFHHLVRTVPAEGLVVCPTEVDALNRVLERGCWTPVARCAVHNNSVHSTHVDMNHTITWQAQVLGASEFAVFWQGKPQGTVKWGCTGEHNIANALSVLAAAHAMGVSCPQAMAALATFPGVKRRMECKGTVRGVRIFDDFAHHPTAIATTLAGARAALQEEAQSSSQPVGRLWALFEPRSNTMKMGTLAQALPQALNLADAVLCYSGGITWDVGTVLASIHNKVKVSDQLPELVAAVVNQAQAGDWVVVMSNGAFGGVHELLLAGLNHTRSG